MRRLLALLLLTSVNTDAHEGAAFGADVNSSLEAVTAAAGLPSQLSAKEDELRIWVRDYMGESITGYLITKPSGYKCEARTSYLNGVTSICQCKMPTMAPKQGSPPGTRRLGSLGWEELGL